MLTTPGTYILVMFLREKTTIKVGRFGHFTFQPGWYLYVGSAHGAGGVRARTNRHKRAEKRKHWHVDYLRKFAQIKEIWYAYGPRVAEHDWSQLLASLNGMEVPVPGFGSQDCEDGCPSHLFRCTDRPSSALLRALLSKRFPKRPPLGVEFVETALATRRHAEKTHSPLLAPYYRGRRYLEERRACVVDGDGHGVLTSLTSFSKDRQGEHIVTRLAKEMDMPVKTLQNDAKFAEAIDRLIVNCGEAAFRVLFQSKITQSKAAIVCLSRTSPERQRHRIEGVASGRMRSVKPQPKDGVFDTISFTEIVSRLARARGSIERCRELLETNHNFKSADQSVAGIHATVTECDNLAAQLNRSLKRLSVKEPVEQVQSRVASRGIGRPSRMTIERVPGQLRSARALLAKNLRDVPILPEDIRPTSDQRRRSQAEILQIRRECKRLLDENA